LRSHRFSNNPATVRGVSMERPESQNAPGYSGRIKCAFESGFLALILSLGWEFVFMREALGKPFGLNEFLMISSGCLVVALRTLFRPISVSAAVLVFIGGLYLGQDLIQFLRNAPVGFRSIFLPLICLIIGFLPSQNIDCVSDNPSVEPKSVRFRFREFSRRDLISLTFSLVALLVCLVAIGCTIRNQIVGYDIFQMLTSLVVFIFSGVAWHSALSILNKFGYRQRLLHRVLSTAAVAFVCPILVLEAADWSEKRQINTLMKPLLESLGDQYEKSGAVPYLITNPADYLDRSAESHEIFVRRQGITYVSDGKNFLVGIRASGLHPDGQVFLTYDSCAKKWQRRLYDCIAGHCISSGPHAATPPDLQPNDIRPYFTGQAVKPSCSSQSDHVIWSKHNWSFPGKRWILDVGDFEETVSQAEELKKRGIDESRRDEFEKILTFLKEQRKRN
jgi:hypothetical protein